MSRNTRLIQVTITRPANATAYTAGDVVGDASGSAILTFEGFGESIGEVEVLAADLRCHVASVPAGQTTWDLHLFNASPTAIADNAAFDLVAGDRSKYLGKLTIAAMVDEISTIAITTTFTNRYFTPGTNGKVYGLLKTVGGFTPGSGDVFVLGLHVAQRELYRYKRYGIKLC